MKKFLIDFWLFDADYSSESRRSPIFSGYRPNMFILSDHKNLCSTPILFIGKGTDQINPGFRGLVIIESDFDLKPDFCVFFNEGERQIGQGLVLCEVENSFLKEVKNCYKLTLFEFLDDDNKIKIEHFYKKEIENVLKLNCKVILEFDDDFCTTVFILTNDKTNYKKLMVEIHNLSFDEFSEIQNNVFRGWWD